MARQTIVAALCALLVSAMAAQTISKPQTVNGLQVAVMGVERAEKASLRDCPPGTNTVNAVQRPGDQLAIVTASFKVMPDFKPGPLKRPSVVAAGDDKEYFTSVQFVDAGSVPEYSCQFVYRVPQGTKLKSFKIENATFDLTALDK
jgi:hypothetical protein